MCWISSILVPTGRTKTSKCWEVGLGFKFKFEFEIRIQKKIKATLIQECHGGSAGRGDLGKDILLGRRLPVQPKAITAGRKHGSGQWSLSASGCMQGDPALGRGGGVTARRETEVTRWRHR